MRILFLSHYFPPEVNAPANRTFEHCREWVKAGHEVHVVTGVPSHPIGKPFTGYGRGWYRHELMDGVHVHRVWTYLAPNNDVLHRVLNFLSFVPTSIFRAWRLGKFDVAIGTSPQFFNVVATWVYAKARRTSWVFELRDLWPESIAAVGAMRKSVLLWLLERLELRMYRDATAVVCVTRAFMTNLTDRGVAPDKLRFVPNGIIPKFWLSGDRAAGRELLDVRGSEVVASYVGTVGMAHGLRTMLDAAPELLRSSPNLRMVIVGDGAELTSLREAAAERGLSNVKFTGLLGREQMPSVLAATDIALVLLKPSEVFKTVLPSKMFEAMAAGRPIALGVVAGEAQAILKEAGAGVCVAPGDADDLARSLSRLARDPVERQRMGESGMKFVEQRFSRQLWATRYLAVLEEVERMPLRIPRLSGPRVVAQDTVRK